MISMNDKGHPNLHHSARDTMVIFGYQRKLFIFLSSNWSSFKVAIKKLHNICPYYVIQTVIKLNELMLLPTVLGLQFRVELKKGSACWVI